jgi:hypothetical protein
MTVSTDVRATDTNNKSMETVISGRGFLGLPQRGISVHVLKSEPSAIHHLNVVERGRYRVQIITFGI